MNKIESQKYQEHYYEEVLDNGLHVIIWEKPDYEQSAFALGTPFGGTNLQEQDKNGNIHYFTSGIAHFLEHKMFETKHGDAMDTFSKLGADVNAYTSYHETCYYFSTTNDPTAALHELLDFVQELHISKESVTKEKGIIIQELELYKQMSDSRMMNEVLKSLYQNHPLKHEIIGTKESIHSITKEQLEECYLYHYHPSQMVLVGVTSKDPQLMMDEIKKNQAKKVFPKIESLTYMTQEEPKEVARKIHTFQMPISIPKVCVAYKIDGIADPYLQEKTYSELKMLLDAYLSTLNPEYQQWIDQEIILDTLSCGVAIEKDYGHILCYAETNKIDAFLEVVNRMMKKIQTGILDVKILQQLKKRYFGQSIRSLNSFEDIAIQSMECAFKKVTLFEMLDILYNIDENDLIQQGKKLDINQQTIVIVTPEDTN